jgi:integrase
VESMNNTAWHNARSKAGLGDLHVHDLRHTVDWVEKLWSNICSL